jgi:AraC family transcriptional regulator
MQALQKANYSGKVLKIASDGDIIASLTDYDETSFNGLRHYHDNAHVSFVLQGFCKEKKNSTYDLAPGKITFYSAGETHQVVQVLRDCKRINLEIEPCFFEKYQISDEVIRIAIQKNPDAKFLILKMFRELIADDNFSAITIESLLLLLIDHTQKIRHEHALPAWVRMTDSILHERCDEKISLKDLSVAVNVHPVTISRYFPHYFSCTIGEYTRKLKIEKALSLMRSPDSNLTNIAHQCGFFDQSHFIRNFKSLTGFLPTVYQRL